MTDDFANFFRIGRETAIRSCALRILLAATISIARVIFCVFLMLRIFVLYFFSASHY